MTKLPSSSKVLSTFKMSSLIFHTSSNASPYISYMTAAICYECTGASARFSSLRRVWVNLDFVTLFSDILSDKNLSLKTFHQLHPCWTSLKRYTEHLWAHKFLYLCRGDKALRTPFALTLFLRHTQTISFPVSLLHWCSVCMIFIIIYIDAMKSYIHPNPLAGNTRQTPEVKTSA